MTPLCWVTTPFLECQVPVNKGIHQIHIWVLRSPTVEGMFRVQEKANQSNPCRQVEKWATNDVFWVPYELRTLQNRVTVSSFHRPRGLKSNLFSRLQSKPRSRRPVCLVRFGLLGLEIPYEGPGSNMSEPGQSASNLSRERSERGAHI